MRRATGRASTPLVFTLRALAPERGRRLRETSCARGGARARPPLGLPREPPDRRRPPRTVAARPHAPLACPPRPPAPSWAPPPREAPLPAYLASRQPPHQQPQRCPLLLQPHPQAHTVLPRLPPRRRPPPLLPRLSAHQRPP